MFKKIILSFAALAFLSCKNDVNSGFKGKWIATDNNQKVIVISKTGENYTLNLNDEEKFSAIEDNGILKIIISNDTIIGKVNDEKLLIIENESFKKLNGRYTNPGAGIY